MPAIQGPDTLRCTSRVIRFKSGWEEGLFECVNELDEALPVFGPQEIVPPLLQWREPAGDMGTPDRPSLVDNLLCGRVYTFY